MESVDRCDFRHGHRRGFGIHGGGRRGDHEYHAGGGHRAHPRNRHSQVGGRAAQRHTQPVSGGIGDALSLGRGDRDFACLAARCRGEGADACAHAYSPQRRDCGRDAFGGGGIVLRDLSGAARGRSGSH